MRKIPAKQSPSYPNRLPDAAQEDALHLLDVSREVINATVAALWPQLDAFGTRDSPYAYQKVTALIGSNDPHESQWWNGEGRNQRRSTLGQSQQQPSQPRSTSGPGGRSAEWKGWWHLLEPQAYHAGVKAFDQASVGFGISCLGVLGEGI